MAPKRCTLAWALVAGAYALLLAAQLCARGEQEIARAGREQGPSSSGRSAASGAAGALKCAVVAWHYPAPKPELAVVCPPEEIFAPLRIYLGLSWEMKERLPGDLAEIVAPPRTIVLVEFKQSEARVQLRMQKSGEKRTRQRWVSFSEITRIGLATEP